MATSYTSLLGFALPVTGELSGTWGDVVNQSITELVEDAIAGSATADVTSADWTLTTTGSGATNQARNAILIPTGTPGVSRNIIAPSQSKAYIVDNQSDGAVVVKGSATTGATVAAGTTALVAWDGSDFVLVAQDLANVQGTLAVANGGTGATTLTGYVKGSGTSALTASSTIPNTDITGLGTMSTQNATSVNIDGGAIDGTPIGANSASTGAFTSITGTSGVISANSSSDALRITQTGSGNALVVEDSANPDSTPFVVNQSGTVIVGGSTELFLTGVVPSFQIEGAGNSVSSVYARYSADTEPPRFLTFKSRNATIGAHTIVNNNDTLSEQRFYGSDGTEFVEAARIRVQVDGTPGTNDMPGRLVFATTPDGGSSPVNRVIVDNQGRVGIAITPSSVSAQFSIGGTNTFSAFAEGVGYLGTFGTGVSSRADSFFSYPSVNNPTGTLNTLNHYFANQNTFTTAVTNQIGYIAESGLTGATNNYGFYSNIASGTGRWNFYAAGSAANYFAGNVGIGVTDTNYQLVIGDGTTRIRAYNQGGFAYIASTNNAESAFDNLILDASVLYLRTAGTERLRITSTGISQFKAATQETKVAVAASDIDQSLGNYFTKTISGATTFTVSNTAASGLVSAFVLDLTNGGSATVTWFSGLTWSAGTAPTLTASGVDTLAFFTYDGGTTWRGFVLGQAMA